jgi:hypothetical protein
MVNIEEQFDREYIIKEAVKEISENNLTNSQILSHDRNWLIRGTDKSGNFKVYDGPIPQDILKEAIEKLKLEKV